MVYLVLIAYLRFAKKRFIGQATAVDFILVIIIGSISSRAISGTAPFFASLAGTFVLILMHWVISYYSQSSKTLSHLVKGNATTLIRNGKIDRKALASAHMSDDDLDEDLRQQGVDMVNGGQVGPAGAKRQTLGDQKMKPAGQTRLSMGYRYCEEDLQPGYVEHAAGDHLPELGPDKQRAEVVIRRGGRRRKGRSPHRIVRRQGRYRVEGGRCKASEKPKMADIPKV